MLKKELGLIEVFAIASGAMISSGLFVLPSLAFQKSGPSVFLAYFAAAIMMLPALLVKVELSTAMPKSGGTYFFIYRSLGPLSGTFAGFLSWISLCLKTAFALVGIGIFLAPYIPWLGVYGVKVIAVFFTLFFMGLNIFSVKHTGRFQVYLVALLLLILCVYIIGGLPEVRVARFEPFLPKKSLAFWGAAAMIFISYGGLTKVAAVAEEVKDPGKNIPGGMFASYVCVSALYVLSVFVTVGILTPDVLEASSRPLSDGAAVVFGEGGSWIMSIAGMFAFITTANAGLLASSRSPLAMAEDNLIPPFFAKVSIKLKTPVVSILTTGVFMIIVIVALDLERLVKTASTMMLLLFFFVCFSAIIMRESRITSYKPLFKMPFYPFLPGIGMVMYIGLILTMGLLPLTIALLFVLFSFLWYRFYSHSRVDQESALIHIVERASNKEIRSSELTRELMDILRERDGIIEDRFDQLIHEAIIDDMNEDMDMNALFQHLAKRLSPVTHLDEKELEDLFLKREAESTTVIHPGLAIPHIIIPGENEFEILVVRSKKGIDFGEDVDPVHIVFALAGSRDERNFHLQALMAIAQIVQNKDFMDNWLKVEGIGDLKNLILLAERVRKGMAP